MQYSEENHKLAEELHWDVEEIYLYHIAQATPDLEIILANLKKAGHSGLAENLEQFIIDVGTQIMDGIAPLTEPAAGPQTGEFRSNYQPVKTPRLYILLEILPYIEDTASKLALSSLIKEMPFVTTAHPPKPTEPGL